MSKNDLWNKLILILPSFTIVFFVTAAVIANTLKESLGYIPELSLNEFTFKYFAELLKNKLFLSSLSYSFYIALISSSLSTMMGLYLGYKISSAKANFLYRYPLILSYIAGAALIVGTFGDKGLLYHILSVLGLNVQLNIIYNPNGIAVILLNIFKGMPFVAFSVGPIFMKNDFLYKETAINLGCSNFDYIMKVLLPISKQAIITSFLIILNYNLFSYEGFYFLGPSNPVSLGVLAYETHIQPDLKYRALSMAINFIMILISIVLCLMYYYVIVKFDYKNKEANYEAFK